MPYSGELAALGTAVMWSLTGLLFSYSGRRIGSDSVNRTRLLFALVYISLTHLLLEGSLFPFHAGLWRWGWLSLSSVLGLVLGDGALFYAYVLIGPRLAMLVMSLVPILSALAAWLAFGETITRPEALGILVAVAGVAWVITERQSDRRDPQAQQQYGLGLLMAFLGALGQTSNLIFSKFALVDGFSALSATQIRLVVGALALWGWTLLRGELRPMLARWRDRRALAATAGGALVGPFLGIWLSLLAVQSTRVGIASTLMALPPVLLIPLTYLLYGERITRRALVGTLIALGGVALLFLI